MTIANIEAPVERNRRDPIRWRAMRRVAWLQYRATLIGLTVVTVGCAIAMILSESSTHASYANYVANGCAANLSFVSCGDFVNALGNEETTFSAIVIALHILPVIVGLFIGAPLVAREIESGTFRYAWTQETGRTRNVMPTFVILTAFITVVACFLGLVLGWYGHPFEVVGLESQWQSGLFDTTVFMLGAWTIFAFSLGTLIGTLIGRTVAAMAATTVAVGAMLSVSFVYVVHWLLSFGAISTAKIIPNGIGIGALNDRDYVSGPPPGSWLVRGWITGPNGHVLGIKSANYALYRAERATQKDFANNAVLNWLTHHNFTYWVSYQPASRFWIFQLIAVVTLIFIATLFVFATNRALQQRSAH